jgi:hypothetical protein
MARKSKYQRILADTLLNGRGDNKQSGLLPMSMFVITTTKFEKDGEPVKRLFLAKLPSMKRSMKLIARAQLYDAKDVWTDKLDECVKFSGEVQAVGAVDFKALLEWALPGYTPPTIANCNEFTQQVATSMDISEADKNGERLSSSDISEMADSTMRAAIGIERKQDAEEEYDWRPTEKVQPKAEVERDFGLEKGSLGLGDNPQRIRPTVPFWTIKGTRTRTGRAAFVGWFEEFDGTSAVGFCDHLADALKFAEQTGNTDKILAAAKAHASGDGEVYDLKYSVVEPPPARAFEDSHELHIETTGMHKGIEGPTQGSRMMRDRLDALQREVDDLNVALEDEQKKSEKLGTKVANLLKTIEVMSEAT